MSVILLDYNSQECEVFNVCPRRIFLNIEFSRKETHDRLFMITNKTTQHQKVTLDYPVTEFFQVPKVEPEQLQIPPQKSLEIPVKCHRYKEARPYYDLVKVVCSKGCGTYVRLIASPTIRETMKIPFDINLGSVPLGETAYYNFKIPAMKDSSPFLFISSIYNPDLTISPMKGTVHKEPKTVVISYLPRGYITLAHPVHLYLPSISALPLMIYVTADTKPGKLSEMIYNGEKTKSKLKQKLPFVRINQNYDQIITPSKKLDWSQHKTNLFLLKKSVKNTSELELMGPFGRQMKEEEEIKKNKQANFLKEVISFKKACMEPLTHNRTVLKKLVVDDKNEWDSHWKVYEEALRERTKHKDEKRPLFLRQRLMKTPLQEEDYTFTPNLPNLWFVRQQILNKFIEAVRRIVIYNRLMHRLDLLKNVCYEQEATRRTIQSNDDLNKRP